MKNLLLITVLFLIPASVLAKDVLIVGVPDGCEANVKEMAAVAVERFIRGRDVKVAETVEMKAQDDVDAFRAANSLSTKYAKTEENVERGVNE